MEVKLIERECDHCGHKWFARVPNPATCPKCSKIISKDYRAERSSYMTTYSRTNFIGISVDGKTLRVKVTNKRPHPGVCELCGKELRLGYHHWDDDRINMGLWLCNYCHMFAEVVDSAIKADIDLVAAYLKMKRSVELQYDGTPNVRKSDAIDVLRGV